MACTTAPAARTVRFRFTAGLLVVIALGAWAVAAAGQPPPMPVEPQPPPGNWGTAGNPAAAVGFLDEVVNAFYEQAAGWGDVLESVASRLFWTLASISLAWTFATMVLARADLIAFFVEFVRFGFFTGLYYWMLDQGPENALLIMRSLLLLAGHASGDVREYAMEEPSGILSVGFILLERTISSINWLDITGLPNAVVLVLLAMAVLVVLALIAANMLSLLIAAWLLAYGGIFFLGFGGARWTSDMAVSYYKSVLSLAAQAYGMVLVAAVGVGVLQGQIDRIQGDVLNIWHLAVALVVVLMMDSLIKKIPPMLGALTGGAAGPQWGRPRGLRDSVQEIMAKGQFTAKSTVAPYSIISRLRGK